MATYKTKNGVQTGFVPGVGEIVDGMIEGPENLEGANLVKVEQLAPAPPAAPAVAPASPPVQPSVAPPTNTETH